VDDDTEFEQVSHNNGLGIDVDGDVRVGAVGRDDFCLLAILFTYESKK
jgi:hypothetical protein